MYSTFDNYTEPESSDRTHITGSVAGYRFRALIPENSSLDVAPDSSSKQLEAFKRLVKAAGDHADSLANINKGG